MQRQVGILLQRSEAMSLAREEDGAWDLEELSDLGSKGKPVKSN